MCGKGKLQTILLKSSVCILHLRKDCIRGSGTVVKVLEYWQLLIFDTNVRKPGLRPVEASYDS